MSLFQTNISHSKSIGLVKSASLGLAIILSLSACQSLTPQQQREQDQQTCAGYGFKPQTDAFANCMLQLNLDRRADVRAWQNSQPQFITPSVIYQPVYIPRRG